jgi:hypothetical protein
MSQFMVVPPMVKVAALFKKLTGKELHVEAFWSVWEPYETADIEWLRPFIRPCHQKILNETLSGEQPNPMALLRQLLRPHGMRIESKYGVHTITISSPVGKTIREKEGIFMDWNL